ncbi:hypothetical protein JCM3765_002668 [Sporobolomyces pararoseus]
MSRASRPALLRLPDFLAVLRTSWSSLPAPQESVLLGPFAILLYAFLADPERTPPTSGPQAPNEIIWRLLTSCLFPANTVPIQFKAWRGEQGIAQRPFNGHNSAGLQIQADVVATLIPFREIYHLHLEPNGHKLGQEYNVAEGPYLLVDLISSSDPSSHDAQTTLAILLHVLFFLANVNRDMGIPTREGIRGQAVLDRLTVPTVERIVAHGEWKRWKPFITNFVRNANYRENLASSAARRYNGPEDVKDCRWFTIDNAKTRVWSTQDFQAWIQNSIEQFSALLRPVVELSDLMEEEARAARQTLRKSPSLTRVPTRAGWHRSIFPWNPSSSYFSIARFAFRFDARCWLS